MRRACFFLAFKKYFYVHADGNLRRAQGVYRREQGLDWRFVITSGPRIDTPFRIEWTFQSFKRNYLAIRRPIAQHWLPWIAGPLRLVHRLAVIVRVKKQRMFCTRRRKVAINHGWCAGSMQGSYEKAAFLQPGANDQCIEPDVDSIAGYVRQRKQLRVAAHDFNFMLLAVFADSIANGLRRILLRRQSSGEE